MKRESILICLILFLLLQIALPSCPRTFSQTAAPSHSATLRLAGLRGGATIRRDERGIPYVEAANEDDLYFAQGYATASDRLWQMDLLRRTGRGELSEIFGRAALEEDKHYRTYRFAQLFDDTLSSTSPAIRSALQSYARGVNAFIQSRDDNSLPIEFRLLKYKPRPWSPADSLVVSKTLSVALSTSWRSDLMREALAGLPDNKRAALLPESSPLDVLLVGSDKAGVNAIDQVPHTTRLRPSGSERQALADASRLAQAASRSLERAGLYAEELAASNNWVVSGKLTASSKPMLANDPHLSASAPSIWYMTHLSAPDLRVAGVTIPGLPGIIIGHNNHITWGSTNLGADVQDLYVETFDPADQRRYKTPQGWAQAEVHREEIKVRKGFSDTSTESIFHEVIVTRHGPIILAEGAKRYALRWTALDSKMVQLEAFYQLNRARNWNEFRAALRNYREPSQNFVYADIDGHIGYYAAGEMPIRKTGDGSLPYDGATDAGEWVGTIPFEKLPHLYDPPSGIIVTANNRVVGSNYPYVITREWVSPYRARRILDLLKGKRKLTEDDFLAIQADTYSLSGKTFAREAVKVARESAQARGDAKWAEALGKIEQWGGYVKPNSRGALLTSSMRSAFRFRILSAALGPQLIEKYSWANSDTFIDYVITERPREWLPDGFKDYAELLYACYKEVREGLTKQLGADESKWEWEYLPSTQVRFAHPLADAPLIGQRFKIETFPQSGSASSLPTVNAGARVSMRFIADLSDWDKSRMGIALGQSGDPSSPHWKDQLDDWRAVKPRVFPFSKSDVARVAKQTLTLAPASGGR